MLRCFIQSKILWLQWQMCKVLCRIFVSRIGFGFSQTNDYIIFPEETQSLVRVIVGNWKILNYFSFHIWLNITIISHEHHSVLTHWGRDIMSAILLMTFSNLRYASLRLNQLNHLQIYCFFNSWKTLLSSSHEWYVIAAFQAVTCCGIEVLILIYWSQSWKRTGIFPFFHDIKITQQF